MNPFDTDGSEEEEQSLKKKPGAKSQPSVHRGFPKLRLKKKKAKTIVGKTENKGSANPNTLDKTAYGKENKPATASVSASEKITHVVTNETRPGKEDKKSTNPFDDDSDEEDQFIPRRNVEPQRKVHSDIGPRERGIDISDLEKGESKKSKSLSFSRGVPIVRSSTRESQKGQKKENNNNDATERVTPNTSTTRNDEQRKYHAKENTARIPENVPSVNKGDTEKSTIFQHKQKVHYTQAPVGIGARAKERISSDSVIRPPVDTGNETSQTENVTETNGNEKGDTKKPKSLSFSRGISKVRSSFGKGHKSQKRPESLPEKAISETTTIRNNEQENIYVKEKKQEAQEILSKVDAQKVHSTYYKTSQNPFDDSADEEDDFVPEIDEKPHKGAKTVADPIESEITADKNNVETKKPKTLSFSRGISKVRSSFGKGHKSQKREDHAENLTEKATSETPTIGSEPVYTKENRQETPQSLPTVKIGNTKIISTSTVYSIHKKNQIPIDDDDDEEDEPIQRKIIQPQKKVQSPTDQFQTENAADTIDVEKGEAKKSKALSFSKGISKVRSSFGKGHKSQKRPESLTEKATPETPTIRNNDQDIYSKENRPGGVRESLPVVDAGVRTMVTPIQSTPKVHSIFRKTQNPFDDDEDEPDPRINVEPQKKVPTQTNKVQTENAEGIHDLEKGENKKPKALSFSKGISKVRSSFGKGQKSQKRPESLTERTISETPTIKRDEQEHIFTKESKQGGVRESLHTVDTGNKRMDISIQSTPMVQSSYRTSQNPFDDDEDDEPDVRINIEPQKKTRAQIDTFQTENSVDTNDVETKVESKISKSLSFSRGFSKVRASFGKGHKGQKSPEILTETAILETPAVKSNEQEDVYDKENRQNPVDDDDDEEDEFVDPRINVEPHKNVQAQIDQSQTENTEDINDVEKGETKKSKTLSLSRSISKVRSSFGKGHKSQKRPESLTERTISETPAVKSGPPKEREQIFVRSELSARANEGRKNDMAEMKVSRQEPPVKLLMEEEPGKRNLSIQSTTLNPIGEDERRVSSTVYENINETDETNTASKPFHRGISKLRSSFKRKSKNLQKEGQQDVPPESPVKTKEMESPVEKEIIPLVEEPPTQRRLTVTEVLADLGYTPDGIEINSTENHSEDTLKKRKSSKKKSKKDKKHGKGEEDEQSTVPLLEGTMGKGDVSPPVAEPLPQRRPTVEEVLADLGCTPDGIEINSTKTNEDDTLKKKPSKKKSKKTKKDKKEEDNVTEPLMERRTNSDLTPEELFPKMASPFGKVETGTRHHSDRRDTHLTLNPFDDITEEENEENEEKVKTHKGNAVSYAVKRKLTILRAPFKRSKSQSNETADESPESPAGNQDILPRNESQGDTGEFKFIQPEPPVKRQLTEEEVLFDHGFTPESVQINPNSPEEELINQKSKKKKKKKKQDKVKDGDVTEPLMAQISTERANEPYVKIINPGQSSSKMSPTKEQLTDMRTTVDDVKGVLTENLQKLEERAGNLDELETRADDLALKTTQFVKVSVEVNNEMKSRNCRWKLIIGLTIAFVIGLIVLVIIIVTVTKQSDSTPTKVLVNVNSTRTT